ncbi:MAG: hypothetical protein MOB07_31125 [Acidobacteria bacterium]|nr:hypothetical protein [Acidobacteriota bacterium]
MEITNTKQAKRLLKGRTIVNVEVRSFRDGRRGWATHPVITFDDGSKLLFHAQETELDRYGVALNYVPPVERRRDES